MSAASGAALTMPALFTTPGSQFYGSGAARGVLAAFHIPGTAQVLYPPYTTEPAPTCFDFATNALCAPFTAAWNSQAPSVPIPTMGTRDYGYAVDPIDPEHCLLGLGHSEIIWRFQRDGQMGPSVCGGVAQTVKDTFHVDMEQFCFHQPDNITWTTVEIIGRPTQLTGGTITLKDSAGNVIGTPITVTSANSYTLNIPATGLNSTVTVEFTPIYTGGVPTAPIRSSSTTPPMKTRRFATGRR